MGRLAERLGRAAFASSAPSRSDLNEETSNEKLLGGTACAPATSSDDCETAPPVESSPEHSPPSYALAPTGPSDWPSPASSSYAVRHTRHGFKPHSLCSDQHVKAGRRSKPLDAGEQQEAQTQLCLCGTTVSAKLCQQERQLVHAQKRIVFNWRPGNSDHIEIRRRVVLKTCNSPECVSK